METGLLRCIHFVGNHSPLLFFCLLATVGLISSPHWVLNIIAKREVDNTPRVPMNDCKKHGLYPKSAAFHTTAFSEGRPDLDVEHCPFCVDENMKLAERKLRQDIEKV